MKKLIRVATVPQTLKILLRGQLKFMSNYYNITGVSSDGEQLEAVSKDEGIQTIAVEMTRSITPFKDLKSVYKLYKLFKKKKPFIVHSHTPKAGTLSMIAAKLAGVPHRLHTIAGLPLLEANGAKRKLLDLVEKITYACATKIYPNSLGLKKIILKNKYTKASKLKILGNGSSNGIDTEYFDSKQVGKEQKQALRKELKINADTIVFIYVGRLVKDKGIHELIDAFDTLYKKNKNCKLLLVGGFERGLDPLSEKAEKLINTHNAIVYVGFKKDVRPYFSIADVLVFPSYREGFPNVVMQAGAMGIPSIVTDINGCNEIIKNGTNGLIIPPKDEKALLNAMFYLVTKPKKRLEIGDKARPMIVNRYQQYLIWEALLQEYKKLEHQVCLKLKY